MRSNKQAWWWLGGLVVFVLVIFIFVKSGSQINYVSTGEVGRPSYGSTEANIILEEFSDFQCPACKSAQATVKEILTTFGERVYFRYYHYPLVNIHPQAFKAALAAECANDQGKFWEYHDKLFENQPNFSSTDLISYANQLELVMEGERGFLACLESRAKTNVVRQDIREGDSRGVRATPTFFLNGEPVQDWSQLKNLIQSKFIGG